MQNAALSRIEPCIEQGDHRPFRAREGMFGCASVLRDNMRQLEDVCFCETDCENKGS